jgi:hypothetical protein
MTRFAPVGSVLKLSGWDRQNVIVDPPTWLLVIPKAPDDHEYIRVVEVVPGGVPASKVAIVDGHKDTLLVDPAEDEFEVFKEDEWPDHVCAAIARWRLMQ